MSRAHNPKLAGLYYPAMPEELQHDFLGYELGVDVLFGLDYADLLDVFARINSYTVSLNKQEKLNAKYLGFFKQAAYSLGIDYVDYFLRATLFTRAKVARMAEAELSSDLLMSLMDGVQTNKSVEQFYKAYDDDEKPVAEAVKRFHKVMAFVGSIYPADEVANTNWSRVQLFYTLFTSIAHCLYGLKGLDDVPRAKLAKNSTGKARVCLDNITSLYDTYSGDLEDSAVPNRYRRFINQARRGTTDTGARRARAEFVCEELVRDLGQVGG